MTNLLPEPDKVWFLPVWNLTWAINKKEVSNIEVVILLGFLV
jgi:hypothetical protein